MTDEPIHVQVAHKLGWTHVHAKGSGGKCPDNDYKFGCGDILLAGVRYAGRAPENMLVGCYEARHDPLPEFDKDWASLGPIIERLGITVAPVGAQFWGSHGKWHAGHRDEIHYSDTPLLAVCALLLALPDEVVREGK